MSHKKVSVSWIASKARVTARTVQRAAMKGEFLAPLNRGEYHRDYEMTPQLEEWIQSRLQRSKGRTKMPTPRRRIIKSEGPVFPKNSLKKWLDYMCPRIFANPKDFFVPLAHSQIGNQLDTITIINLLLWGQWSDKIKKAIWLSPESISKIVGLELGEKYAMRIVYHLRKIYPLS